MQLKSVKLIIFPRSQNNIYSLVFNKVYYFLMTTCKIFKIIFFLKHSTIKPFKYIRTNIDMRKISEAITSYAELL